MKELNELLSADPAASFSSPCGCQGCGGSAQAAADPLDVAALETQLDSLQRMLAEPEEELEFATIDDQLASVDDLELASLGEDGLPSLEDVVKVAERYPGLKITLSF